MGKLTRSPPITRQQSKSLSDIDIVNVVDNKSTQISNNTNINNTSESDSCSTEVFIAPSVGSEQSFANVTVGESNCTNCLEMQKELFDIKNILKCIMSNNSVILSAISTLDTAVKKLSTTVVSNHNSETVNPANKPKFSDIVKGNKNPVVVFKPRNTSQSRGETVKEIKSKLDPKCVAVGNIRGAANGGLIVECKTVQDQQKLKDIAQKALSENYTVNVPTTRFPMLRIVGISSMYTDEELVTMIKDHNELIFLAESRIKIVQRYRFSRTNTFGVKVEVDPSSFDKCITNRRIRICWDMCPVFEAFGIVRCFNCNDFYHVASNCTAPVSCAKCSGCHNTSECTSTDYNCINCKNASASLKMNLDTAHPAWSDNCRVFLEKLKHEKRRINYDRNDDSV